ncbi:hypothetical protein ACLB2K_014407 [Fragaria x ananassa]
MWWFWNELLTVNLNIYWGAVEPCPGVNIEGIETARQRLEKAFQLTDDDHRIKPDSLVEMFSSLGNEGQDLTGENHELGVSKDALYGSLSSALERTRHFFSRKKKTHHFKPLPDHDSDDPVKLENAAKLIHDAFNEMETSGGEKFSPKYLAQLAETLKSKETNLFILFSVGNKAMESKQYTKAIALYDCAIAFCENNAVYHCNRAAAYIEIHKHNEAMRDCLKSIEIDPNYSKGYTRLGVAYYALGNYRAAIDKGFKKGVSAEIDRAATTIRISLFSSSGSVPVDFANMFTNMGETAYQGQHPEYNIRNTIVNGGIHLPKTASPICVLIRNSTVNGIELPRTASSISVVIKNSIVNGVDLQEIRLDHNKNG